LTVHDLQEPHSPEVAETVAKESHAGSEMVMLRIVALVVLTAVLAGVIRLVGLTREPLFMDETFSGRFSGREVHRILDLTARDIHPPLYYLGLASWRGFFGDTMWDLRTYSVLWSLVGVGALALLAGQLAGGRGALLVVIALAVVHPLDVYFAQTARMYSQLAALSTLAAWLLWRWMISVVAEDRISSWSK
jgi:mannosyltransferase